ncbi:MAG TPA: STAS domain-containing protein [Candidatus Xenobia bacterium]|jgi:anti-sigma B factor antagonist
MPVHDADTQGEVQVQGSSEAQGTLLDFSIQSRPLNDDLVEVRVEGEIDVATAPKLREILYDLIGAGNYDLALDFNKVHYIDSTGMGVLVGALRRVREHDGRILLICKHVRIKKLFTITGLSRVFDIFDSEQDLLAKYKKRGMP